MDLNHVGETVLLLLSCFFLYVNCNQYNPHVYPHDGPFFEGWYIRFLDFQQGVSFGCLWGRVLPKSTEKAKNLAFVGLISAFDNKTKLQQFNSFPDVKDVKVSLSKGASVSRDPSPSTPTDFTFIADAGATEIHVTDQAASIRCDAGDALLEAQLGAVASWGGRGPMALLELLPGMPLFWFVHSLHSPVLRYKWTEKKTGKVTIQGNGGYAHMEKNWGKSFPEGWIWIQGMDPSSLASLAITYGPVGFGPLNIPGHLIGYRDPNSKLSIDFRPDNSFASVTPNGCEGTVSMTVRTFRPPFYKLTLMISAPLATFSDRLYGPMSDGFRPVCRESFAASASVKVFNWIGTEISAAKFRMAALEFGGKFMCSVDATKV